nr:uncharacterized mitochondrial protein AtMg00810-like [Tanacetum cinerariifolium]
YQANPKESHLIAVKSFFIYLKGTPSLGLWYPKYLGFNLNGYSDSDYVRCNMDIKSTLGGCQLLGGITTTTTTSVTDAQLKALIDQGVARALAAHDDDRNTNGDDSHNSRTCARRTERVTREYTYPDFMNALTWWNSHVTTVVPDAAYAMNWVDMKKKMTDKYCPRGEMKKLKNKIERYVGGLPDVIHGSVVASRPKTMQEAIEIANELIDKRNNSWAERHAENKRKVDDTFRSNQSQQQQ